MMIIDFESKDKSTNLTIADIEAKILETFPHVTGGKKKPFVWGVPRGGWIIASIIERLGLGIQVHNGETDLADIIIDDIIDSGDTYNKYYEKYPDKPFYTPFDNKQGWLVFPWEGEKKSEDSAESVINIIRHIGDDPTREGLVETPQRVVNSWEELYGGYSKNPKDILKVFSSTSNQMVICKDIEFYSTCEHHMIPFFGKVHIGYLPGGCVAGLSKLARVVEVYARRLQIQEKMTEQIMKALSEHVPNNKGVMVITEARHLCMCGRGVGKQNSTMTTSAISGSFADNQATRNEFLHLVKHG